MRDTQYPNEEAESGVGENAAEPSSGATSKLAAAIRAPNELANKIHANFPIKRLLNSLKASRIFIDNYKISALIFPIISHYKINHICSFLFLYCNIVCLAINKWRACHFARIEWIFIFLATIRANILIGLQKPSQSRRSASQPSIEIFPIGVVCALLRRYYYIAPRRRRRPIERESCMC